MNAQTAFEYVERCGFMAGVRGNFPPEIALKVTTALMEEGINVFELTMNSVQPVEAMLAVKREFGGDAIVGMGTVLDVETSRRVLDAGAEFIVSPAFQPDIVEVVVAADILIAPGVLTPSEAVHAWGMGIKLLKLFPIGAVGVDYLKAIIGPLGHMKFMCNGAMNADNAREFFKAGATACGMAGWLTGDGSMPLETIRQRTRLLRQAFEEARTGHTTRRA